MVDMRYPAEKLAKYPHMFPKDIAIWERFLDRMADRFTGFSYDVKVGEGRPDDPRWDENIKRMNYLLSTKRIDAVGYQKDRVIIFEVKPDAGPSAIGQVMSYADLYRLEGKTDLPIVMGIVTNHEAPDIIYLTQKYDIELYIV